MSPLLLLLLGSLAALATPSLAQKCGSFKGACGLPYAPIASTTEQERFRPRRQAEQPTTNAAPPSTDPVPYSSCGAVVISDRFLLTAAYCVLNPNKPISSVRLGDLDLSVDGETNSRPADYDIELILIHPNFTQSPDSGIRYSDLALLKTVRKIEFNEVVFPYCISGTRPTTGTTVIGAGFGYVNETHKTAHLQEAELNVMSPAECEAEYRAKGKEDLLRQAYPGLLQGSGTICAGHPGRGACEGDEGGPLKRVDESGCHFLDGIISYTGDVCGTDVLPSVSTSVADHYDFISGAIQHA